VIGNDLKIIGQGLKIISRGILQVDGEIEGDVQAAEVIVGEKGQVSGMVAGRQVVVRGMVSGVVSGQTVALQASSHVDGDVHHMSFAIEMGAQFEGQSSSEERGRPRCGYRWKRRNSSTYKRLMGRHCTATIFWHGHRLNNEVSVQRQLR
jgi:cytoskeletal protein CcmA (bactofilin family)